MAVDGPVAEDPFILVDLVHELLAPVKASGFGGQKMQQLGLGYGRATPESLPRLISLSKMGTRLNFTKNAMIVMKVSFK